MKAKLLQLAQQLRAIWKQLGLNQRITVVFTAVAALAALVAMIFWTGRPDFALLYGKMDDAEAAKVTAVLEEAHVPFRLGQGGGSIYVPRGQVYPMRMQLAARGLPKGDGVGFEIFDKSNFGISDFVQRANYVRALQGELARTIAQLDDVEAARVMVVMPENRLLADSSKRPTASVFVRSRGELSVSSVNSIRFLVANAVEGLQPSQVTVVDNRGQVLSENHEENSVVGLTSSQLQARRDLEQYLGRKAQTMLDAVLGPGQSVVRVAADINFDSTTTTEERYDPEGQVIRTSTMNDETTDSTTASDQNGAVGLVANTGSETNAAAAALNNSRLRKKTVNNEYEINRTVSNITQAAGRLRQLSAAVFVAARTEGSGAQRKAVPRTPEELEKLRRIVQTALGIRTEGGTGTSDDKITLEEMPFTDQFVEVAKDVSREQRTQEWWTRIQNGLFIVLALGIFFVFWRMLHKTPVDNFTGDVPLSDLDPAPAAGLRSGAGDRSGAALSDPGRLRLSPQPGPVLSVEVFNQLVRENPENMSQAIQTWLAQGRTTNVQN